MGNNWLWKMAGNIIQLKEKEKDDKRLFGIIVE